MIADHDEHDRHDHVRVVFRSLFRTIAERHIGRDSLLHCVHHLALEGKDSEPDVRRHECPEHRADVDIGGAAIHDVSKAEDQTKQKNERDDRPGGLGFSQG